MKKIIYISVVIVIILLLHTSCDLFGDVYYPDEELVVSSSFDSGRYVYSDKVLVLLSNNGTDCLRVKTYDESNWQFTGYDVLSGDFKEVAWYNYLLFIHMEYCYYSFDISKYQAGVYTTNSNNSTDRIPKYDLKMYTNDEFVDSYPDYKSFEWYNN